MQQLSEPDTLHIEELLAHARAIINATNERCPHLARLRDAVGMLSMALNHMPYAPSQCTATKAYMRRVTLLAQDVCHAVDGTLRLNKDRDGNLSVPDAYQMVQHAAQAVGD